MQQYLKIKKDKAALPRKVNLTLQQLSLISQTIILNQSLNFCISAQNDRLMTQQCSFNIKLQILTLVYNKSD